MMNINNLTYEEKINQLKRIYRLRQLQEIVPWDMTFEEYFILVKELYTL